MAANGNEDSKAASKRRIFTVEEAGSDVNKVSVAAPQEETKEVIYEEVEDKIAEKDDAKLPENLNATPKYENLAGVQDATNKAAVRNRRQSPDATQSTPAPTATASMFAAGATQNLNSDNSMTHRSRYRDIQSGIRHTFSRMLHDPAEASFHRAARARHRATRQRMSRVSDTLKNRPRSLSSVLCCVTGNVGLVLYLASFAAPFWATTTTGLSSGLWITCGVPKENTTRCVSSNSIVNDAWASGWVIGLQALATIGLLGLIGAVILINCYIVCKAFQHVGFIYTAICGTVSCVGCAIIVLIVYGIKSIYDDSFLQSRAYLAWAFFVHILAVVHVLAACATLMGEYFTVSNLNAGLKLQDRQQREANANVDNVKNESET